MVWRRNQISLNFIANRDCARFQDSSAKSDDAYLREGEYSKPLAQLDSTFSGNPKGTRTFRADATHHLSDFLILVPKTVFTNVYLLKSRVLFKAQHYPLSRVTLSTYNSNSTDPVSPLPILPLTCQPLYRYEEPTLFPLLALWINRFLAF